MPSIQGAVSGQDLTVKQRLIVSDTHNYITAVFSFSPDWDGTTKFVMFRKNDKGIQRELVNDCIVEDSTLNLPAGIWKMSIEGCIVDNGELIQRITTREVDIVVRKNSNYSSEEPFPTVPSLGEQILAKAIEAFNVATSVKEAADRGDFDGKDYEHSEEFSQLAQQVREDHECTHKDAEKAETFAKAAEQAAVEKGFFFVEGEDDGHLYMYTSNVSEDITLRDENGRLVLVYDEED